ncbi:MAG TPA: hypothetical protein VM076_17130 [Gemmatimonadaceae bacterium]|nr:hypothetical protein [Gemmatimonadaceae bacterium]
MAFSIESAGGLVVITFSGSLTGSDLQGLADELLALERGGAHTPPRLTDLRGVDDMAVGYPEIARLADRSRARPLDAPIRSALVVGQPVQLGIARMFQILNEHPRVTVRIFDDELAARTWLSEVPTDPPATESRE